MTDGGDTPASASRPGLRRTSWNGAKAGFRITSYVIGPFSCLFLIPGLLLLAFGLGTGHGVGLHRSLLAPFGLYFVSVGWGMILGALIGLVAALIARARPGRSPSDFWNAANRPLRLFRRRRPSPEVVEAFPPRRRLWPWLVGVPIALLLAIALGLGIYGGRSVSRRLADAIAAADRDDPNWQIDDLMAHRRPVADDENSAIVIDQALALLPESWPAAPRPSPGEPNPPTTAIEEAYARISATPDNVRLDDPTAAVLRDELKAREEAVRLARTVASFDRGRHELDLGPTLIDTPLPETQAARSAARLLAADAAIRAQDGDLDGALDSCRALLNVARSIGDEPFLISQLVHIAIGSVAMTSARRVLAQGEPSEAALAKLQAQILHDLAEPLLLDGMKGERAVLTELIRRVRDGEVPISALSDQSPPFGYEGRRGAIAPWGKLLFDNQRAVALEWMNEAVAIARRPAAARPPLWAALQGEIERVRKAWYGPYVATLPILMTPSIFASVSAHARYQGELGATAIVVAAERHRRKTGRWPSSIAAIDPTILAEPPIDPFSGEPFRLEVRDGQLLVYSIGPDHKDDHSAFEPKRWMNGGPDDVGSGAWDLDRRGRAATPE